MHPKQILHMLVDCFKDKINPLWIQFRTFLQMQTWPTAAELWDGGIFFKLNKYNRFYTWPWLKSNWNRFQPKWSSLKDHLHGKVGHGKTSMCSKSTVLRSAQSPHHPFTGGKVYAGISRAFFLAQLMSLWSGVKFTGNDVNGQLQSRVTVPTGGLQMAVTG